MSVTGLEVVPYALPFERPYVTALGELRRREMVLLRLHTDDGLVGLGEAVPLSLRGGVPFEQIEAALGGLSEQVAAARPEGPEKQAALIDQALPDLPAPARCAIHTARLDLAGKSRGVAASQLVQEGPIRPIPCNATLSAGEPDAVAAIAVEWASAGFKSFKLKLGTGRDVEQVRAVREALGGEARIRVDANGRWDVATAAKTLDAIGPLDVELAEQPVATLEEMAELRRISAVPLAGDESIATIEDAERAAALGACEMATLKLQKVGGPFDVGPIAAVLPCYLSSALDGPIGIAAAGHVTQWLSTQTYPGGSGQGGADPGVAHGLATQRLFADTIAATECELRDGELHLPQGPGLGVELDHAALARLRLNAG